MEDHVGEEALNSNLLPKLGFEGKILHASFPNHLLDNHLNQIHVSLCLVAPPQGGKTKHHWVTKKTNAKLPHHKGCASYQVENEMPLIHHVVKHQGYNYTIEDEENLNGRTQGHSMSKPNPKLK